MQWKRILLVLSLVLAAWRFYHNAFNGAVAQPAATDRGDDIALQSWSAYLPPYQIERYSNVTALAEMLLFAVPNGCFDDILLFVWNQFITYEVHYEWEMHMTSPLYEGNRTVKLTLASDTSVLAHIAMPDDQTLVISVWFHPRTYISIMRILNIFFLYRQTVADISQVSEALLW